MKAALPQRPVQTSRPDRLPARCAAMLAAGITSALATHAVAGLQQAILPSPGGYVQTCAFPSTTGGILPGEDLGSLQLGPFGDFDELYYGAGLSASVSSAYAEGDFDLTSSADGGMGYFRGDGFRDSPNDAAFALGAASGGWKETYTISHPALNGQAGHLIFQVRVRGTLEVTGLNGSAVCSIAAYKNNVELSPSAYFDPGSATGTTNQRAEWAIASFGSPGDLAVNSIVTMAVPITFGQSFNLGVYTLMRAGHRSQDFTPGSSTAQVDFATYGTTWAGIASVRDAAGAAVSGYSIVSATGINWSGPLGNPCKPDLTTGAIAGQPGYGSPNGVLNNDDFFYYLAQFAAGNLAVADLTTGAIVGQPGYGVPNGVINNDDFFYYLAIFAAGC